MASMTLLSREDTTAGRKPQHGCMYLFNSTRTRLIHESGKTRQEQVASTVGGARYLATNGHLAGLLAAAGGGAGDASAGPDPLLGASALRTVAKVLVKSAGVGVDVSLSEKHCHLRRLLQWMAHLRNAVYVRFFYLRCVLDLKSNKNTK